MVQNRLLYRNKFIPIVLRIPISKNIIQASQNAFLFTLNLEKEKLTTLTPSDPLNKINI